MMGILLARRGKLPKAHIPARARGIGEEGTMIKKDCQYFTANFCLNHVRKLDGKNEMTSCDWCIKCQKRNGQDFTRKEVSLSTRGEGITQLGGDMQKTRKRVK